MEEKDYALPKISVKESKAIKIFTPSYLVLAHSETTAVTNMCFGCL